MSAAASRARSTSTRSQDADLAELNDWAPKLFDEAARHCPSSRTSPATSRRRGRRVSWTIDRDTASRLGISPQVIDDTLYDAFGQRQVTQYFTQLNPYHVVLEVEPELAGRTRRAREDLSQVARPTGQQVPLSAFVKYDTRP